MSVPRRASGTRPRITRVFLVDDQEDTRDLYAEVLRAEGFFVDVAADAEEALGRIESAAPDIVVTDYFLPDMDGFDLCRAVKKNPKTTAIQIIVVTGYGGPTWTKSAREAGASLFLTKPLLPSELASAIRALRSPGAKVLGDGDGRTG